MRCGARHSLMNSVVRIAKANPLCVKRAINGVDVFEEPID